MPQVATKLFRKPEDAEKALAALNSGGYRAEEVSILVSEKGGSKGAISKYTSKSKTVTLPVSGAVLAVGAAAAALANATDKDQEAVLAELWNIPAETVGYYQFGISVGGVVVSVHTEGDSLAEARRILRAASSPGVEQGPAWASRPSFVAGNRMAATNPVDAPMSGDFRRY